MCAITACTTVTANFAPNSSESCKQTLVVTFRESSAHRKATIKDRRAVPTLLMRIDVISDTHGLLRDEVLVGLAGADLIIHAGDVGDPAILERLSKIARTVAVRGNVDRESWAEILPIGEYFECEGVGIYVIHDRSELDPDPATAGVSIVISGHSHVPSAVRKGGVLYLDPGSVGPRRFRLPVSMARLEVKECSFDYEMIELEHDVASR